MIGRKLFITALFILVFWLIIPGVLISSSLLLDNKLSLSFKPSLFLLVIGIFIMAVSASMLALSISQFSKFTKGLPISAFPPSGLIQKGIYAVWRHPIYLFYSMLFFGLVFVIGSQSLLFIFIPLLLLGEAIYIFIEEKSLQKRFGNTYKNYKKRTALIVPKTQFLLHLPLLILFKWLFSIKVINKKNIPDSPPFFVVSSHRNYLDPFFISVAIKFPVHYITTYEVFRSPISRFIFRKLLCIPKKRYLSDINAARGIRKEIARDSVIGIFPEGERSWTGKMRSFKPESLRLLKRFPDIPILPVKLEGNYYSWPRWGKNIRKAKLTVIIENPIHITPEMKIKDIDKRLKLSLNPLDSNALCRSKKRADNIGVVLYRCPECSTFRPFDISGKSSFCCLECRSSFSVDNDYSITYRENDAPQKQSIDDLYEMIKIKSSDIPVSSSPGHMDEYIACSGPCTFYQEKKDKLSKMFVGQLGLSCSHLTFINSRNPYKLKLSTIKAVTIESNFKLQIYGGEKPHLYQIIFNDESVLKWQDYIVEVLRYEHGHSPVTR